MKKQDIKNKDTIVHQKRALIYKRASETPEIDRLLAASKRVCRRSVPCNSTHDSFKYSVDVSESQDSKYGTLQMFDLIIIESCDLQWNPSMLCSRLGFWRSKRHVMINLVEQDFSSSEDDDACKSLNIWAVQDLMFTNQLHIIQC